MQHFDRIPPIGLGTFRLKGQDVQQPVREAIRVGYRHIDTATIYRNEKEIGLVLQELYADPANRLARSDLWITSKLSPYDMRSPRASLLKSLSALQTDYLDLYLIHWPGVARKSASSPVHKRLRIEAWKVLNEAKIEGLIRHIGVSNFTPQHLQELVDETDYGLKGAFVQMEIHPWYWRDAMEIQIGFAKHNVVLVGYALLAEGKLSGPDCPPILDQVVEKYGTTRVQVVLAWALKKFPGILVRSGDLTHLRQNLDASSTAISLTPEEVTVVDDISSAAEEKLCWDPSFVK
ncbi:aldo keto reductase [Phlyctema vagabunda]|uniref:Aldo keto reductase n=1 Tax=Phlyctema vagabunda TaxID=108571 RepID=A0ABR4P871_9HELO